MRVTPNTIYNIVLSTISAKSLSLISFVNGIYLIIFLANSNMTMDRHIKFIHITELLKLNDFILKKGGLGKGNNFLNSLNFLFKVYTLFHVGFIGTEFHATFRIMRITRQ